MKEHNFERALDRLREALASPDTNEFKVDICIKRFEFTYEVCKKTLEQVVHKLDLPAATSREVLQQAGLQGFITDMEIWEQMREDRNDTAHEYDEEKAQKIYTHVPAYAKEFEFVLQQLKQTHFES